MILELRESDSELWSTPSGRTPKEKSRFPRINDDMVIGQLRHEIELEEPDDAALLIRIPNILSHQWISPAADYLLSLSCLVARLHYMCVPPLADKMEVEAYYIIKRQS